MTDEDSYRREDNVMDFGDKLVLSIFIFILFIGFGLFDIFFTKLSYRTMALNTLKKKPTERAKKKI